MGTLSYDIALNYSQNEKYFRQNLYINLKHMFYVH